MIVGEKETIKLNHKKFRPVSQAKKHWQGMQMGLPKL
jgi:hypothetical protein